MFKARKIKFLLINLLLHSALTFGQENKFGTIRGQIRETTTRRSLAGANILVVHTAYGAVANVEGEYAIQKLPVGSYSLRVSLLGYQSVTVTDVIVKSDRITFINLTLQPKAVELTGITITSGYFSQVADQPVSSLSISYEEIRRAPGSGGDISRILSSLPSVAKVNDQTNSLIVRGGSPLENAFYVDNIEIPNINHFPTQGASGGPLSLINVDFIKEVNFIAGGFSSVYGDKLSSIMDLSFREGNREELDGQCDLNFAGFGGVLEGPLAKRGSWMISARRSYIDLLAKHFEVGTTTPPRYGDYQGKMVFSINPRNKLTLLAIWGDDHNHPDREAAEKNDMIYYGRQDIYERTTGLNWQTLWGKYGFSNLAVSLTVDKYDENFNETSTGLTLTRNHSRESIAKVRNVNSFSLRSGHSLDFGFEAKRLVADYDNFYAGQSNSLGEFTDELILDKRFHSVKAGGFVNYMYKPLPQITVTTGLRYDWFHHNSKGHASPRASLRYQLSELTLFHASAGRYYQNLPMILLVQAAQSKELLDLQSVHYVIGLSHLLSQNTRLTLEAYSKVYLNFPMDPAQPGLFMLDEIFYRYAFFFSHTQITSQGKAESRGVEITVQKKMAEKVYGMAGLSVFTSRYQGLDGVRRQRVFDNRVLFSMEGGYKPSAEWEISGRWVYAGGTPFTPLDLAKSSAMKRDVLDETAINARRYPAYHSLNVRFDRRFHFNRSNLIFYLSAWNLYDRKNVAGYFWNEKEQKQDVLYQWRILPIFGLEYEF